ncbi:hypothetical protein BDBG_05008 [Blastomyces gilchristii SLH14081]|uniref:Uncharacterized protein n=1 Tax=Blastomyces gilchristii (strain SLH14081) TaxID=559298 RepID=A0A179UNV6_BLAGS|nr:uncharacterized protein BDBG_05008 [Blastomyces gilchristii SLH14081]OAT08777.1 hypothetical protein BDBG_05008 [Blastomyces gilchristii SLH14081]
MKLLNDFVLVFQRPTPRHYPNSCKSLGKSIQAQAPGPKKLPSLANQSKPNINSKRNKEDNIRFFILISLLLFTVFALANPEPAPTPDPQLGDISEKLRGIGEILTGEFPRQVQSAIRHVDDLLDGKSTKVTKNLLMTAGPATTPALLKKVSGLLDDGSKLLAPDFVNPTKNLIKKASKLLDTVDALFKSLGL